MEDFWGLRLAVIDSDAVFSTRIEAAIALIVGVVIIRIGSARYIILQL